ncbi:Endonuclease/exonuclease/phosphatase [Flammula alnicola]|nr:Endonuclease/exonuclease/phosphatase [Flammula alnicola]
MTSTMPLLLSPAVDSQAGLAKKQQVQQPTVLNRLQGLFPHSPQIPSSTTMTRPGDTSQLETMILSPPSSKAPNIDPKFLKIRLLTWNMHDSLPKGDLEDLLGKVPLYTGPMAPPGAFPYLLNDGSHPYHLVVVAGQECPTPSGIPMGLAAGFKILDKDRDKSKEVEKDHDKPGSKAKDKHDDSKAQKPDEEPEGLPSGWTSMVEDWLSNNGASSSRTNSPSTADVGFPRPLIRQKSTKDSRRGPYQLLIKDRLMGIYMAIYIHRDLKPFVRGMSKSAVTAGLIGGRVGNKGGLGISLNIDGTTFLFLNAHLAAHEGKINHRLANLTKIKSELSVDDFLAADDSRKTAEDLTDKFDFAFLCGDLNFRLNISRLHADWLISRQDYAQAFEFDQLNAIMKEGKFFTGFHEAPIKFPPTFKYDVLRTIRRSKHSGSKHARVGDHFPQLTEVEEREMDDAEEVDEDIEGASVTSSAMTSVISRATERGADDDPYFYSLPSTPTRINSASKASVTSTGANKAKAKFLSLLSPSFITSSNKLLKAKHHFDSLTSPATPTTPGRLVPPSPLVPSKPNTLPENGRKNRPPPMILVNSKGHNNGIEGEVVPEEKGVYDSSNKKRVPSWCDRILWKTTIAPPPDPLIEESHNLDLGLQRPRYRMGQFFANAFRPQSSRSPGDFDSPSTTIMTSGEDKTPTYPIALPSAPRSRITPSSVDYRRPIGVPGKHLDLRPRRANTAFSPPPTAPLPSEWHSPRRSTGYDNPESTMSEDRPQSASQSIWRFLPAFLSPTHNQGTVHDVPQLPTPAPTKGDVMCLSYNTLDDRGMRRLEGRSDHRPVIGTYVVYV